MEKKHCFGLGLAVLGGLVLCPQLQAGIPSSAEPKVIADTDEEPIAEGKFKPTWESLEQYEVPEWFRDAKFGIWAHWGPQCQPEASDWYARGMYLEGTWQYKYHLEKYGHPSEFGFKDVIHEWKAERWDPERLVKLYKRTGARYFFAMANHHDNLDMWDSKYQPWNSVAFGPKKNIIAGWAKAAHDNGLPFGVSVHAAHAWSWYEPAQGADKEGPKAGVPYDGKLTKTDGKGTWWEGLDPQDLYEQRHEPSPNFQDEKGLWGRWDWNNGVSQPDQAYCNRFYNRTMDLINKYHPDLIYYDDTVLPLWPVSDVGLKLAAHYYNSNMKLHGGKLEGVMFGKVLDEEQRKAITWDVERGAPPDIVAPAWQTCTCIGNWHYDRGLYERDGYKSAKTVIQTLADIVSKNGNLLLNIPVRGDGSIDEKEEAILEGIADWMDVNKECIFGTRPWKVFGEGPATEGVEVDEDSPKFNEGKGRPLTWEDVRFTTKGDTLYAIILDAPEGRELGIKSLGLGSKWVAGRKIKSVELLGSGKKLEWKQTKDGLKVKVPGEDITVLKITGVLQ